MNGEQDLAFVWAPVCYPTIGDFRDFKKVTERCLKFNPDAGLIKIVAPKEWSHLKVDFGNFLSQFEMPIKYSKQSFHQYDDVYMVYNTECRSRLETLVKDFRKIDSQKLFTDENRKKKSYDVVEHEFWHNLKDVS